MRKVNIPKDLQIVGLVLAVGLTAMLVEKAGNIDDAFWLFLKTLPVSAFGVLIYKLMSRDEFEKPKSWPEWILLYIIGLVIGGVLVSAAVAIFKAVS